MQYELTIPDENRQAHVDIEKDISERKEGLFTFVIRIHDGRITDYNLMESVDAKTKYFSANRVVIKEFAVTRHYRK